MAVEGQGKYEEIVLYTDISPEFTQKGEKTINECFGEEFAKADRVEISVAYCACDALQALDRLVIQGNIKYVCLILGMYFFIGFAKKLHTLVMEINDKWNRRGIGEIRLTHDFKHHGKLYCFYKNNQIFSAIQGSSNLSFLFTKESRKPKQYEMAWFSNIPSTLEESQEHMERLKLESFSGNVVALEKYRSFKKERKSVKLRKKGDRVTYKKRP